MTTNPNPYNWIIEVADRHAGSCSLFNTVDVDRRASYAIGIDEPSLLGQGLGQEATRLVLAHAFGPAGLHRVDLRLLAYNTRAIACYLACGFVEEGRERQAALVDGAWHDFVIMAILESDPGALSPEPVTILKPPDVGESTGNHHLAAMALYLVDLIIDKWKPEGDR